KPIPKIPVNAAAQKSVANAIEIAEKNFLNLSKCITLQQILTYHYLAWVSVASVSHTETHKYSNTHYCFASIKYAKQFVSSFADMSIIIFQDDKAKIGFGVSAISQTFHRLQSINDPIHIPDHDFCIGFEQKLVLLVYLIINPNKLNNELQTDLQYDTMLKTRREIRLIWVLLVDGGLDENLRHLKNIKPYCLLFRKSNLDYLTIRTNASGQSKYNLVERRMTTLSGKLADTDKEKMEELEQQSKENQNQNQKK
ncbi:18533_t:CDS:2, partial [Gigaspora margarita]